MEPADVEHCPTTGKRCYRSITEAWWFLKRTINRRHQKRDTLKVYRCPFCGRWHLGNDMNELGRNVKAKHGRWWRRKR